MLGDPISGYAQAASAQTGVPYAILMAVAQQEEGGNWSPTFGYMGIEPPTAAWIKRTFGVDTSTPAGNVLGAAYALKSYYDRTGQSWTNALAYYNQGAGGYQSPTGQNYAASVLSIAQQYGNAPSPAGALGSSSPGTTGGQSSAGAGDMAANPPTGPSTLSGTQAVPPGAGLPNTAAPGQGGAPGGVPGQGGATAPGTPGAPGAASTGGAPGGTSAPTMANSWALYLMAILTIIGLLIFGVAGLTKGKAA